MPDMTPRANAVADVASKNSIKRGSHNTVTLSSQRETGMPQESPAELGISADPLQPGVGSRRRFFDGVRAEVGQLAGLQVPPDQLDGVEVVRIARQLLHDQPSTLGGDPGPSSPWSGVRAARPR